MARNMVQFQKGLSEAGFAALYGSEDQCHALLAEARWPDGFSCPECGGAAHCVVPRGGRRLFQCNECRKQTSVTAGTVMHRSKLPLTTWFRAIYLITQTKQGISSIELGRRLGVTQTTAWLLKQKLAQAMLDHNAGNRLAGPVQADDAYLGGARSGGKRGRGAAGKTPFVAAVETTPAGRPLRIALRRVRGFRKPEIAKFADKTLASDVSVTTDGLRCFEVIAESGRSHSVVITGSGPKAAKCPAFKWVNTALGNIKAAIVGTYRAIRCKHVPRYLAEFEWRFNHRFDLAAMIPHLATNAIRVAPMPYAMLKRAEGTA